MVLILLPICLKDLEHETFATTNRFMFKVGWRFVFDGSYYDKVKNTHSDLRSILIISLHKTSTLKTSINAEKTSDVRSPSS